MRHVLTSEAVTRGHSDKLCDQVADGVLDALLTEDPEARAACEAAVWENHLRLFGEISARLRVPGEAGGDALGGHVGWGCGVAAGSYTALRRDALAAAGRQSSGQRGL